MAKARISKERRRQAELRGAAILYTMAFHIMGEREEDEPLLSLEGGLLNLITECFDKLGDAPIHIAIDMAYSEAEPLVAKELSNAADLVTDMLAFSPSDNEACGYDEMYLHLFVAPVTMILSRSDATENINQETILTPLFEKLEASLQSSALLGPEDSVQLVPYLYHNTEIEKIGWTDTLKLASAVRSKKRASRSKRALHQTGWPRDSLLHDGEDYTLLCFIVGAHINPFLDISLASETQWDAEHQTHRPGEPALAWSREAACIVEQALCECLPIDQCFVAPPLCFHAGIRSSIASFRNLPLLLLLSALSEEGCDMRHLRAVVAHARVGDASEIRTILLHGDGRMAGGNTRKVMPLENPMDVAWQIQSLLNRLDVIEIDFIENTYEAQPLDETEWRTFVAWARSRGEPPDTLN
ncbi:hypothetical protein [Thioalkalivibrio thiocyanodenitrificans]|uniref:hypothetical protein n=1 Tax=Thioalkalivibrio thiocyanodenitrificans TaxID=243063 RepID=UPI00036434B0|nr:hypothetical protein [Thioalkalivibrio thiocyanodenitrificans]